MSAGFFDLVLRGIRGGDVYFLSAFQQHLPEQMPRRYVFIGNTVASPALLSLPESWAKATFAIALGNFLMLRVHQFRPRSTHLKPCSAGGLYSHTAAKIVFVRYFRDTKHMYTHTVLGWAVWVALCVTAVAVAFILAIAVPIFSYLIGGC